MASKISYKDSNIHGKGIFASRDIVKSEVVCIIKGPEMFKVNRTKKDALSHPDWVGFKLHNWIDPVPPYKYLNHSCNPNTGIKGNKTLIALRDLKKGEEITIDYSIIEADSRWHMKCDCKSRNCRGLITSIQKLPQTVYNSYVPYIPYNFKRIYARSHKDRQKK